MHRRGAMDRYLSSGLSPKREARMRAHLRACARCRRHYDDQVRLLRAFASDPSQPTAAEDERAIARALAGAGLSLPSAPKPTLFDTLVEHPLRYALVAAALLLLLVGGAIGIGRSIVPPPAPLIAGQITAAKGVTVDGQPAEPGTVVVAGAQLAVEAGGAAEVELERGAHVRLFPSSRLRFTPRGETVELAHGKVWCAVEKNRGAFVVRTDDAVARVLGTSFVVEKASDGDTDVRVMSGTVEVQDREWHDSVRVRGGQRTHVAAHGSPSATQPYDGGSDRDEWDRLLTKIGRALKRAIKTIGDAFK